MSNQIRLSQVQVTSLSLNVDTFNKDITSEFGTKLRFEAVYHTENQNNFAIVFDLELENEESAFVLKLKATAHFEADNLIDDDFKSSPFVKISAPAIAFSYIRTFISNLTLNSGYEAIMLPSFNFIKMSEEREEEK